MLITIKNLLKAFDDNGIAYCHWKSNEHIQEALDGDTDLDVLFDPVQRTLLERILDECGLKRFRATPLMQYTAIEDYIGFDQAAAKIWHLHIHYRMTLGEKHLKGYTITPWGTKILKSRIRNDLGIYTAAPEYELVLLLCRIALKLRLRDVFSKLGADDCLEYEWLVKRIDTDSFFDVAVELTGRNATELIKDIVRKKPSRKSDFIKLQRALRKEFKLFTSYNSFTSRIQRTIRELFWLYGGIKRRLGISAYSANRRVSPSGGTVVAILGCDGAGKSTTIEYVKKEFNKKIDVTTIYFGSGDGSSSLLRKPMKLVAQKVGGKGLGHSIEKEYSSNKRVSLKARLYSLAKIVWAITLASEKKKKISQMVKARNNGLLVITDRYPQTVMPGCSDGPLLYRYKNSRGILLKMSEYERRIYYSASVNPPDLTIKLMVPTDIAIARKPEMTAEEIETKKNIVMNMNNDSKSVLVDTSRSFEVTRGEVMKAIWDII